ncbi:hypothetical protein Tco_0211500 [Tanacetum coccineum]
MDLAVASTADILIYLSLKKAKTWLNRNWKGKEPKGWSWKAKAKVTLKKLIYDDSEEEVSDSLKTKGLSERFFNESFGTSGTRDMARSSGKSQRSLSRSKTPSHLRRSERLGNKRKSNAKVREGRTKSGGRRSEHKGISSDSDCGEDSVDTREDLSTPYQRSKPMPFTTRIIRFKYRERSKLPRNVKVYEGSEDPEDHLGIFTSAAEQEEWTMLVWCKIFCQTLSGAARKWFDDLDPKSVDNFEELSQKFLEEFVEIVKGGEYVSF